MSVQVEVTVTRSQVAPVGSLASYHTYYGPDGHFYECWAEIETSPAVRGRGLVKRNPLPGSPEPAGTWVITAHLRDAPAVQAKITEVSLAFDPHAFAAHQPFVRVGVNAHEPRATVPARAWEFGDAWLPGVTG